MCSTVLNNNYRVSTTPVQENNKLTYILLESITAMVLLTFTVVMNIFLAYIITCVSHDNTKNLVAFIGSETILIQ